MNYRRNDNYRINKMVLKIALVLWVICVAIFICQKLGVADKTNITGYILCQPGDYVNARSEPSRKSRIIGRLDTGDAIEIDGEGENGFLHCVNATFEEKECWVYCGYVVLDKPEWMNGRNATVVSNKQLAVRKNCTGSVRQWLQTGDELQVFWFSNEWCVTNRGFVKTKFIELDGE